MNLLEIKAKLGVSTIGGNVVLNEDGSEYHTPDPVTKEPTGPKWVRRWFDKSEFGRSFSVAMAEPLAMEIMADTEFAITTLALKAEEAEGDCGPFTKYQLIKYEPQKYDF